MTRGKSGAPGFFTMGAPLLLTALLVLMEEQRKVNAAFAQDRKSVV